MSLVQADCRVVLLAHAEHGVSTETHRCAQELSSNTQAAVVGTHSQPQDVDQGVVDDTAEDVTSESAINAYEPAGALWELEF